MTPRIAALVNFLQVLRFGVRISPMCLVVYMPMHVIDTGVSTEGIKADSDVRRGGEGKKVKGCQGCLLCDLSGNG